MVLLFILQFALPLVLVALIGVVPPRSFLGFLIQILATATGLFAASLTGIWMLPLWWTPYAFGGILLVAIIAGLRKRRPFASVHPSGVMAWIIAAFYFGLGAVAVIQTVYALASRVPPSDELVDLAFPLDSGIYLVVNGGSNLSTNAHLKTLDTTVSRFHAWRGQSFGVDLVKIDRRGLRVQGLQPSEPNVYQIYGASVLAPCDGEIVFAIDSLPDMKVPETDRTHMAGNHLILRCGAVDVVLGHLRPGSLKVAIGGRVAVGDHLAMVGNSGNTDEPHLHIHAQRPGTLIEPMSGDPLPMRLGGRFLVRNDRIVVP